MWMPVFGSTPCACFSMFSTCTHMLRSLKIKAYSGRWTAVCALEIAELCKTLCLYIINSRESACSPLLLFALFCSTACCKDSPSLIAIISDVTPSDAFRWLFKHPHTNTQHEHKCYTALPKLPESRNLESDWLDGIDSFSITMAKITGLYYKTYFEWTIVSHSQNLVQQTDHLSLTINKIKWCAVI